MVTEEGSEAAIKSETFFQKVASSLGREAGSRDDLPHCFSAFGLPRSI